MLVLNHPDIFKYSTVMKRWAKQSVHGIDSTCSLPGNFATVVLDRNCMMMKSYFIKYLNCSKSLRYSDSATRRDSTVLTCCSLYTIVPGYGKENIGRNAKFLQGPMTEGYMVEEIMESLRHADPLFCKLQNHKPDGSVYQLCLCLTPVFNVDGKARTTTHMVLYTILRAVACIGDFRPLTITAWENRSAATKWNTKVEDVVLDL